MSKDISVTIIGSFRRDPDGLAELFNKLSTKFEVLSPASINWDNPGEDFVKSAPQKDQSIHEIESMHLSAIRKSDLVVLFAPSGYVGVSGAMEVGFAHALGVPVVSTASVKDKTINSMIDGLLDDAQAGIDYGRGLKSLQLQYSKIAKRSGWDKETARDTILLMTEEIGELARAVRKHSGLKRDGGYSIEIGEEIADVQLYLAHLANNVGIDLGDAVTDKIIKNQQKLSK